jgi:hypothetical protein
MHVPDEIDVVSVFFLRDMGGHASEGEKIIGPEEFQPVFAGEALAGKNFFFDFIYTHSF